MESAFAGTVSHGGDIYRNRVDDDFSVSVNPLGMPEGSLRAAAEALRFCGCYPDPRGEALTKAIARAEGAAQEQVILGNGAAELLYALCSGERPGVGMAPAPSFGEYEAAVLQAGGRMRFLSLERERDFALTGEAFGGGDCLEGVDILFVCNPNNPTGAAVEKDVLLSLAGMCERRGVRLCVDECFLPFSGREEELSMKRELGRFPHLIVLRAFTKVYAMAGLRLGYALTADGALLGRMRVLQPWNTSLPAQRAGIAALAEEGYLSRTRELVAGERAYLARELARVPKGPEAFPDGEQVSQASGSAPGGEQISRASGPAPGGEQVSRAPGPIADWVCPSEANFLLFHSREDLAERLLGKGILIRSCDSFRGLGPGYFRIAVRGPEENRRLIRCMREVCGQGERQG